MNILVSINSKFKHYLCVMLSSLRDNNKGNINVYCMNSSLTEEDKLYIKKYSPKEKLDIFFITVDDSIFDGAPTVKRYPHEIYYRLLAYKFLPKNVDRVLYLDVDIIVNGDVSILYNTDFGKNLFLATTNIGKLLTLFNARRLRIKKGGIYPNTGVMMLNIKEMRETLNDEDIFNFINKHKNVMALYDEDVVFALYGEKIGLIDSQKYNLSDRQIARYNRCHRHKIDCNWVNENNIIIHYLGPNKPWKNNYIGILKPYYDKYNFKED